MSHHEQTFENFSVVYELLNQPEAKITTELVRSIEGDLKAVAEVTRLAIESCPPPVTFFSR